MAIRWKIAQLVAVCLLALPSGCCKDKCENLGHFHPDPVGTISDSIWRLQEGNAEASDFVVYEHEFVGNTARLNKAGEDHVKQIAYRVESTPFTVQVEPSSMSVRDSDKYKPPVHGNDELDLQRRDVIVRALAAMGVKEVEQRVVVAPALTPGFQHFEAERAYTRGFSGQNSGFGGRGGLGGGAGGGFGGGVGF